MKLFRVPSEVRAFRAELAARGQRLALVPTMGSLHEGHLCLMREGRRRADVVVASIFVNPTQFGPKEDLSKYPRDLEGDLAKCALVNVAAVYAPEPATVYPAGYQTFVVVEELSHGLCGESRPGHFRGVATVVAKLLALFRPEVAVFGEKDYQQLQVIRRLAADLELGCEVVGVPIVREVDGLAMSSRNAYLSADERLRAVALFEGLAEAVELAQRGEGRAHVLCEVVRGRLRAAGACEEYVELREASTLRSIDFLSPEMDARIFVAALMGRTRLIDNMAVRLEAPGAIGRESSPE